MKEFWVPSVLAALGVLVGLVNLALAVEDAQQTGPITVVQQKGASSEEFPLRLTTDEGVSSTAWIRSAHTAARGTITAMNVAIMIDMRICAR